MLILNSVLVMFGLSLILGAMIAIFSKVFEVKKDPILEEIVAALPAYNCGACGFPGCEQYAEAVFKKETPVNKCSPGGKEVSDKLSELLKKMENK
ncbi:MAG: RnfABCDGE type electron transport complex subunit B [Brevinematales bacterium]|nr:RnfABCDGE type electron transport complex subunit B [Brevinematales bacterium]